MELTIFSLALSTPILPNRTWKGDVRKEPSSCSTTMTSMAPVSVAELISLYHCAIGLISEFVMKLIVATGGRLARSKSVVKVSPQRLLSQTLVIQQCSSIMIVPPPLKFKRELLGEQTRRRPVPVAQSASDVVTCLQFESEVA